MSIYTDYDDLLIRKTGSGNPIWNWTTIPGAELLPDAYGVYQLSYSYISGPTDIPYYNGTGNPDLQSKYDTSVALSAALKANITAILTGSSAYSSLFMDVAKLTFNLETSTRGKIDFGVYSSAQPDTVQDYTLPTNPSYIPNLHGDVWLTTAFQGSITASAYRTIMHEIGHSLGLEHVDGLPIDNNKYTIMSYNEHSDMANVFATGLQLYDIAAIQEIYGRNYTTRSGANEYKIGNGFAASASTPFMYSIWDGGGIDKIDATGYTDGVQIDLRQGHFSSIGKSGIGTDAVVFDDGIDRGNVSIAYYTVIENATGTAQSDYLIGNAWNNELDGGDGDDFIYGDGVVFDGTVEESLQEIGIAPSVDGSGDDVLKGGLGINYIYGGQGNDLLLGGDGVDTLNGGKGIDTLDYSNIGPYNTGSSNLGFSFSNFTAYKYATGETDTISSIEKFIGSDYDDEIHFGNGHNIKFYGGAGSDWLIGGAYDDEFHTGAGTNEQVNGSGLRDYDKIDFSDFVTSNMTLTFQGRTFASTETSGTYQNVENFLLGDGNDTVDTYESTGTSYRNLETYYGGNGTDKVILNEAYVTSNGIFSIDGRAYYGFETIQSNAQWQDNGWSADTSFRMMSMGWTVQAASTTTKLDYSNYNQALTINNSTGSLIVSNGTQTDTWQGLTHFRVAGSNTQNNTVTFDNGSYISGAANDTITTNTANIYYRGGTDTITDTNKNTGAVTIYMPTAITAGQVTRQEIDTTFTQAGNIRTQYFDVKLTVSTLGTITAYNYYKTVNLGADGLYGTGDDVVTFNQATGRVLVTYGATWSAMEYGPQTFNVTTASNGAGGWGDDTVNGSSTSQTLSGGYGNDTINSGSANETIYGGFGNDVINAAGGSDLIYGELGDDIIFASSNLEEGDSFHGGAGYDTVDFGLSTTAVQIELSYAGPFDGDNYKTAATTASSGYGIAFVEAVNMTAYADTVTLNYTETRNNLMSFDGKGGSDLLRLNFSGADYTDAMDQYLEQLRLHILNTPQTWFEADLLAIKIISFEIFKVFVDGIEIQVGNNPSTISATAGNDAFNGGGGVDTISYASATSAITLDLAVSTAQDTIGSGTDTIINFENIIGSGYNDTLSGSVGNNSILAGNGNDTVEGGIGNDTLDGEGGTDTLKYSNAEAAIAVNLGLTTAQNTGGGGTDTISNFENLTGSIYNDILTGSSAANIILGGDGNDSIDGGAGNDTLNGEGGTDTLLYNSATSAITVSLAVTTAQTTGGSGSDTISNFENLTGSIYNDTLTGTSGNNTILGGDGNDTIEGGAGNDILNGEGGTDTLKYAAATAAITINIGVTTAQATGGAGSDTISNFENIIGSGYNDTLTGNSGNNSILGGNGNDTIEGGAGDDALNGEGGTDTIRYSAAASAVTISLALATAQNTGGAGIDTISGFENLTGSAYADTLTGDGTANSILGGNGNDIIDGGAGNDTLNGEGGTDTLTYASAASAITLNLGLTTAQATGGSGSDTISNFENLTGSAFNDTLTGSSAANTILGGNGNDIIDGGAGNDVLNGEGGTDTLRYTSATAAVAVSLALTTSQNTGGAGSDTVSNFENLTGSAYADTLTGSTTDNTILGGAGNDIIEGGAGNDTLNGEGDTDTVRYTNAASAVTVSLALATAQATGGAGTDTLSNFENLTGSAFADTLTGGSGANTILGGNGNDIIDGGAGNDILNGEGGTDTLTYASAASAIAISLLLTTAQTTGGSGSDTISNFENLTGSGYNDTLTGSTAVNTIYGGNGADTIRGDAGNDFLYGDAGNDFLYGDGGNDSLTGGAGLDRFVFQGTTAAIGNDTIADFALADDKIDIKDVLVGYDPLTMAITDFVQITTSGANSILRVDVDGGANNFVQIATITGVTSLTDEAALVSSGNLIVS